jgi:predicted DNA-binding protein (MmcQ/YjbR family)
LLFRIGGKIFAGAGLDAPASQVLSFKCTPEKFQELVERNGIIPAPYTARYHWVALERFDAMEEHELKNLIEASYQMVLAKLPKKVKAQLGQK